MAKNFFAHQFLHRGTKLSVKKENEKTEESLARQVPAQKLRRQRASSSSKDKYVLFLLEGIGGEKTYGCASTTKLPRIDYL